MKKLLLPFFISFLVNFFFILPVYAASLNIVAPSEAELKKTVSIQIKVSQSPGEINRVSLFISRAGKTLPSASDKDGICQVANQADPKVISLKEIFSVSGTSSTLKYDWDTRAEQTQVGTHQILAVGLTGSQPCKSADIRTATKQKIEVKEAISSSVSEDSESSESDGGASTGAKIKYKIKKWGTLEDLASEGGEGGWVVGLLWRIIQWMLQIAGSLAVIAIIYSGLMYVTASGNPERVEKAKRNLIWAVTAIVIILLVYLIPEWIYNILEKGSSE